MGKDNNISKADAGDDEKQRITSNTSSNTAPRPGAFPQSTNFANDGAGEETQEIIGIVENSYNDQRRLEADKMAQFGPIEESSVAENGDGGEKSGEVANDDTVTHALPRSALNQDGDDDEDDPEPSGYLQESETAMNIVQIVEDRYSSTNNNTANGSADANNEKERYKPTNVDDGKEKETKQKAPTLEVDKNGDDIEQQQQTLEGQDSDEGEVMPPPTPSEVTVADKEQDELIEKLAMLIKERDRNETGGTAGTESTSDELHPPGFTSQRIVTGSLAPGAQYIYPTTSSGDGEVTDETVTNALDVEDGLPDSVVQARLVDEAENSEEITKRVQEETRRQILSEATHAKVVEKDNDYSRRAMMIGCGFLIVVAVIVGSVLGTQLNKSDSPSTEKQVANDGSKGGKPRPANDICQNAISISTGIIGDLTMINGTTRGALPIADKSLPCHEEENNEDDDEGTPGVWYKAIGTGFPFIVSACGNNKSRPGVSILTELSVFGGDRCDDDSLECIAEAAKYECGKGSTSWLTEVGMQYFVLVRGNLDFELVLEQGSPNDICESAESLVPVPTPEMNSNTTYIRSSINGTYDIGVEECYNQYEGTDFLGPGVWFQVLGSGGLFRVSACSTRNETSEAVISVYSGPCDELSCVQGTPTYCGSAANEFAWVTEPGAVYYLLVRSDNETDTSSGASFELSIEEAPVNDICETAVPLNELLVDGRASLLEQSTMEASISHGLDYCEETFGFSEVYVANVSETQGVWYKYIGTGKEVTVSTSISQVFEELVEEVHIPVNSDLGEGTSCTDAVGVQFGQTITGFTFVGDFNTSGVVDSQDCGGVLSAGSGTWYVLYGNGENATASTCDVVDVDMDTRLSVFRGSCSELRCIVSNDDACGKQSIVTWETVKDEIYYLVVHGREDTEGKFTLQLGGAENDVCEHAIGPLDIEASNTIMGSTLYASQDFGANEIEGFLLGAQECTDLFFNANIGYGVWYYVDVAKNESLTASTCDSRTQYQTAIGIYRGSCGSLKCITSHSNVCGLHARSSWDAVAGERYYILVHGRYSFRIAPHIGIFALKVGKTEHFEDLEAINRRQRFDSYVSVFAGSCQERTCTIGNEHCRSCSHTFGKGVATWISQENVEYLIHIHASEVEKKQQDLLAGSGDEKVLSGPFDLQIQEKSLPFTDFCQVAIGPLPTNGVEFFSTTQSATVDDLGTCGFEITSAGVWFTVLGTGDRLSASTCNKYTYFEARVSIFMRGFIEPDLRCEELECIQESDGARYSLCDGSQGSLVSWKSTDREVYYILVHGYESQSGPFGLTMDFQVVNDLCEDAAQVSLGQDWIVGSTISSTEDKVGTCGDAQNTAAGVWYSVRGTGNFLTANLCHGPTGGSGSEPGLHLSLFTGSCGDLVCMDGTIHWQDSVCGVLTWESMLSETYYVLVSGGRIGRFNLVIDESTDDVCQGATRIEAGEEPLTRSMEFATADQYFFGRPGSVCGPARLRGSPGIWFVFTPSSDGLLVASTCYNSVSADTDLAVFKGSCDDLTCVGGNRNTMSQSCSGTKSKLQFYAEAGVTYHILVSIQRGDDLDRTIQLGIEPFPIDEAPINDMCSGALPVSVGNTVNGTTKGSSIAPLDMESICPDNEYGLKANINGLGVWYVLDRQEQPTKNLTVSTCTTAHLGEITSLINVFMGTCEDPQCVASQTSDCALHWEAESGILYYIFVHSYHQEMEGEIRFQLTEFEAVPNDECTMAMPLSPGGESVVGSTIGARRQDGLQATCAEEQRSRYFGAWYIFEPSQNRQVTVNTCDERTTYGASVIDVYTGECGELVCLPEISGPEYCEGGLLTRNAGMQISWNAEVGKSYYILISGDSRDEGNFVLTFT